MRKNILLIFLFYLSINCFSQETTFINTGKTYEILNKYFVNEIILKPDSTYIQKYYVFKNKDEIENYRNSLPKLESSGNFSKTKEYYFFEEQKPNSFVKQYYMLSDNKLIYMYWKNNSWRKGAKFKLLND